MIRIHSDSHWIDKFVPKLFKVRKDGDINDHSTGTIAAKCFWDSPRDGVQQVRSLSDRYEHVIVYVCEPWEQDFLPDILERSPQNVHVFSDVIWDQQPRNHYHVGNWFMTHHNLYRVSRYCQQRLNELREDLEHKPFMFDALLGVSRVHREFIFKQWYNSAHRADILLTYHKQHVSQGIWHEPHLVHPTQIQQEPGNPSLLLTTAWTYPPQGDGGGDRIGTQHIVPVKIYNDTWCSIIAEGFIDPRGTRLTEKMAKVLVSQRFFVYFGAARDLNRMRRLGFQTFGDIVDESYDLVDDDHERWHQAWRVVEWVCKQDPVQLQRATHAVRLHNRQVFLNTDWHHNLSQHLYRLCAKY